MPVRSCVRRTNAIHPLPLPLPLLLCGWEAGLHVFIRGVTLCITAGAGGEAGVFPKAKKPSPLVLTFSLLLCWLRGRPFL